MTTQAARRPADDRFNGLTWEPWSGRSMRSSMTDVGEVRIQGQQPLDRWCREPFGSPGLLRRRCRGSLAQQAVHIHQQRTTRPAGNNEGAGAGEFPLHALAACVRRPR